MAGKNRKPVKKLQTKESLGPISEKKSLLSRNISLSVDLSIFKEKLPILPMCGILLVFFLFSCWYWCGRYQDVLYLTSNFDTPADFTDSRTCWGLALDTPSFIPLFLGRWILVLSVFPILGGTVLALLGAVLAGLLFLNGRRTVWTVICAILPVSLLMMQIPFQGYSFFSCYSAAPFYAAYTGLIFSAAVGLWGRRIYCRRIRLITAAVISLLGYPAFGFFALLAGILLLIDQLEADSSQKWNGLCSNAVVLVLIILTPAFWIPFYCAGYPLSELPLAGIIFRTACKLDAGFLHYVYELNNILIWSILLPILLRAGWILIRRFGGLKRFTSAESKNSAALSEDNSKAGKGITKRVCGAVVVAVLFAAALMTGTVFASRQDDNFLTACSLFRALENEDWDRILAEEATVAEPSLPLIEARRLALIKTGQAGSAFFDRPSIPTVSPDIERVSTARILGGTILFYYGNINTACRLSMENLIYLRDRSPYDNKMAFLTFAVNGEYDLASIYAAHLAKISVLRPWGKAAEEVLAVLRTGDESLKVSPLAQKWLDTIYAVRILRPIEDGLDLGKFISHSVLEAAPFRDMEHIPLSDVEGTLMAILLTGNLNLFNERFTVYYQRLKAEKGENTPIPPIFQQVFAYQYTTNPAIDKEYPVDESMIAQWKKMDALSMRRARTGDIHGELSAQLQREFGNTWWYYFFHCYQQMIVY